MTASQRRAHLHVWLALGPLAMAAIATALLMRPSPPAINPARGAPPGAEPRVAP